ncbi:MAG: GDSL-type esterase/lipase family protein [Proteobacteria bacterium]|nr:GDSL-type esterase/lipase family protein [Pseudomonadota bacterium]
MNREPVNIAVSMHSGREETWLASPRLIDYEWMSREEWTRRFRANLNNPARKAAKLVFMGDSITEAWTQVAPDIWQEKFGTYHPLSLGIGGDRTQHLLWRIQEGELQGLNPKVLVLLIGTNNLGNGDSVEDTVAGIEATIQSIHKALPEIQIILLGILPAGEKPDESRRQSILAVNERLAQQVKLPHVHFIDLRLAFLQADGTISNEVLPDYLHPSHLGYDIFARELAEPIARLF